MKKRILECPIHGLTLFRCRRKWRRKKGKEEQYWDDYSEKCFKCITEGNYKPQVLAEKKKRKIHIKI